MIHVINNVNRHLYGDLLDKMFKLRHDIFVGQRGWNLISRGDGRDIDQFDTKDTTYFLKVTEEGEIMAGMRLYPTTVPTQLNTIFRDTCVLTAPPEEPDHYEWSRYFVVDSNYRGKSRRPANHELYMGIFDYALAMGIKSLSGFIETSVFTRAGRLPWNMRQLGIPVEYGGTAGEPVGYGLPTQLMVDADMVYKTKLMLRLLRPVLSLSLGERNLTTEKGFDAKVVLAIQNFIQLHPEYTSTLVLFTDMLNSADPYQIEHVNEALNILTKDECLKEFATRIMKPKTVGWENAIRH